MSPPSSPSPSPSPPPDVVVEPADTDDVDALVELWVELATDQRRYGSHLLAAPNRGRIRESMLQHVVADTALLARRGAASGGRIAGFVTFGRESEGFRQDRTRGIVHNIYVRPGDRGEGIGARLLSAAEAALAEAGVESVALQTMAGNDRARAFYRRQGFEPHRVELEKRLESDNLTTDDE
jgi:ribosomal protein S18 acetylase RimI-like enzyme